jgi:hypothetical protein
MAKEIKVKIGGILTEAEAKASDPSKIGTTQAGHPKTDVEPEFESLRICPFCGAGAWCNWQYEGQTFACWNCGNVFSAW